MVRFFVAIMGFVIAGSVFMFYTRPAYDRVKGIQAEIAQYNQALEKAAELQQLKQTLLSRYNAFNPSDLDRLHKLLPDHVDNVRLVLDIDNLASRYGLALQNVIIGNPGGTKKETTVGTIGGTNHLYDSLTFKFTTTGTYDNFVKFMEDLEASLRIVDIVTLTLAPGPATTSGDPLYRYDVTIRTYWLK